MDMDSCVWTVFLKDIVGDLSMDVFFIDSCTCELRHELQYAGVCQCYKGFYNYNSDTEDPVFCVWDPVVMLEWPRMYDKSKEQGVQYSHQRSGKEQGWERNGTGFEE